MDKVRENRLKLFGHVKRKVKSEAVRMIMKINVEGKRGKRRPKYKKLYAIENKIRIAGVCIGNVKDRVK